MMNPSPSALKGPVLPLIYFGVSSNAQPREQLFQCCYPSQLFEKNMLLRYRIDTFVNITSLTFSFYIDA